MNNTIRSIFLFSSMLAIQCLLCAPSPGAAENTPRFVLRNGNDEIVSLSDLVRTHNLVVAFWASYCAPCRKEIPQLIDLEKKYATEKHIRLVLINIDSEGREKADPVLREMNAQGECLFDIYQMAVKGYVPDCKIPATFLIDKKGGILFRAIGESPENVNRLEAAIRRLR
jgi:thiol-disulfide isomerase/thioredoxin